MPFEDAKLMVNLAEPHRVKTLLDPFAGGGGILCAARRANAASRLISADIEAALAPGLEMYSDEHYACDAKDLPSIYRNAAIDAIVTEVPFSQDYTENVVAAFARLDGIVDKDGIIILMCHAVQSVQIGGALRKLGYSNLFALAIDRKGVSAEISAWMKNPECCVLPRDYIAAALTVV
jgi:rhodanese-related sulfurtransferase